LGVFAENQNFLCSSFIIEDIIRFSFRNFLSSSHLLSLFRRGQAIVGIILRWTFPASPLLSDL
ncbi:hypothetical protein, partial [Butyricimonas paravirosa]|uniref:hypothetical protein n=1 Tax=Butyricimonas paravirosa TaxID=1472417 RepID=UPI0022E8AA74